MGKSSDDWSDALTFEQYVHSLFQQRKTDTPEFQLLLRIYGREKLEEIWKKYKEARKP